jgi:uracil phosphoribosyltransferase
MVHNLSEKPSLVAHYVAELRDVSIQKDRMRFRRNIERIGEVIAYEISKELEWKTVDVKTPLGTAPCFQLVDQPVLVTIMRAGLPLHQGILNYFDHADNGFIGAFREHDAEGNFAINMGYVTSPELNDRVLIVCDPMLATGASLALTLQKLIAMGKPSHIHVVCVIASTEGIDYLLSQVPGITIWAGTIDQELNAHGYIVPGLGDAGDLCFGEKIQA